MNVLNLFQHLVWVSGIPFPVNLAYPLLSGRGNVSTSPVLNLKYLSPGILTCTADTHMGYKSTHVRNDNCVLPQQKLKGLGSSSIPHVE